MGRFLRDKMWLRKGICFVVREEFRGRQVKYITITSDVIERMIKHCQFKMSKVDVELSNKLATTEISLFFGSGDLCPISRFPRSLLQDEDSPHGQ